MKRTLSHPNKSVSADSETLKAERIRRMGTPILSQYGLIDVDDRSLNALRRRYSAYKDGSQQEPVDWVLSDNTVHTFDSETFCSMYEEVSTLYTQRENTLVHAYNRLKSDVESLSLWDIQQDYNWTDAVE